MLERIRKSRFSKVFACLLTLSFVCEILPLSQAFALTGGPQQPEVQGFTPIEMSDMVDPFTGDFTYNIPLFDVGGYPINLAYNSGITTDQEASWVGLGWNITPGLINRNLRSLPDDFNGDLIEREYNIKDNNTYTVTAGVGAQVFGLGLGLSQSLSYNNYTGYDAEFTWNPSLKLSNSNGFGLSVGLGISASSKNGAGVTPSMGLSFNMAGNDENDQFAGGSTVSFSLPYNTRAGLQALNVNSSYSLGYQKNAKGVNVSGQRSTSYTFGHPTYTPKISMPMRNGAVAFAATVGGAIFGVHLSGNIVGSYAKQELASKYQSLPAFGYMNLQNNYRRGGKVLLDFNREKDGQYSRETPNLPVSNLTYDIYSVMGQGIGGTYRPWRSDVGILFDDEVDNQSSNSVSLGVEIGLGNAVHGGGSVVVNTVNSRSGQWTTNTNFRNKFRFKGSSNGNPLYEPYYFKKVGERAVESDANFVQKAIGGDAAVQIPISKQGIIEYRLPITNDIRQERAKRSQTITMLNAEEASKWAIDKQIRNFPARTFTLNEHGNYTMSQAIQRTGAIRKSHHISEITTFKDDGSRYVFGIPAYNNKQVETTFAVNKNEANSATGLVSYAAGVDNTSGNNQPRTDCYYDKNTTPGYAHSYLLTAILSPDYVDADGVEGPSLMDMGAYTKFNYTRMSENYQWRTPFTQANYNEGLKAVEYDEKGSYIYGSKEIWYLHSIETKTQVAEFYLAERSDGYGVADENGGKGAEQMKRLEKICIYSLQDRKNNGANAVPIKTVHFEYYENGELCPGIENAVAGKGKLTLKRVYFTYGNSDKSKLNTYEFKYGEYRTKKGNTMVVNPSYHLKKYDRWGYYKPEVDDAGVLSAEFPYTVQDKIDKNDAMYDGWRQYKSDMYVTAWSLSSIKLPSGGVIKVDYEADDYAYVQNLRAMRMLRVKGVGSIGGTNLYGQYRVYFEVDKSLVNSREDLIKHYLTDENDKGGTMFNNPRREMYFRFLVDMKDGKKEYISGYSTINTDCGIETQNGVKYGYITLNSVEGKYNPVSVTGWNFIRLYAPDIAYRDRPSEGGILAVAEAMVSAMSSVLEFFRSYYAKCSGDNLCRNFVPSNSWIRLYNPDGKKKGGGLRVKRLAINDQWREMTQSNAYDNYDFGQEYDYTTVNEKGDSISSGVAAYEPMIGGDENPFRRPIHYSRERIMAADDRYYQEEPFGESFFPAPTVGYSRVTIKNLQHTNVTRNATGKVVHEFYTAKDFPTQPKSANKLQQTDKSNGLLNLFGFKVYDYETVSQAHLVELNDMHGKPKAQWVYQEGKNDALTGVEYKYKTSSHNTLDNKVDVIDKAGIIKKVQVGVDYDFVMDMREQSTKSTQAGANLNLDAFLVGIFPGIVPVILPEYSSEKIRFRSIVTTKVINRIGLLDETIAYDNGAKVSTKNLLYDAETGEVLLTSANNQYTNFLSPKQDMLYSFTYPAHWGYSALSSVYKTAGAVLPKSAANFSEGDIVSGNEDKWWVKQVTNGKIETLIDKQGNTVTNIPNNLKVIQPGKKNQQAMPIGTIVTTQNPIQGNSLNFNKDKILNASAIEYTDTAMIFCECGLKADEVYNPFVIGLKGNWKPKRSFVYLADRTQTLSNNNLNIRYDGNFTRFNPFWQSNGGADWRKDYTNWTFLSEVSLYNPYGGELENRDALGIYSSAIFGYNFTLPISITQNSRYLYSGFDGFEDYKLSNCAKGHFNFKENGNDKIDNSESHTGRHSIRVSKNQTVGIVRQIQPCPPK